MFTYINHGEILGKQIYIPEFKCTPFNKNATMKVLSKLGGTFGTKFCQN